MTSPAEVGPGLGLTTIPRAVLSVAAGVLNSVERAVVGAGRVRTAQGNAWEAICADRDRARQRDEVRELVAALAATAAAAPARTTAGRTAPLVATVAPVHSTAAAGVPVMSAAGLAAPALAAAPSGGRQRTVGSSPRSSASQASRVPTGPAGSTRPGSPAPRRS